MRTMLIPLLLLAGCATAPSPQAVAVRDADQKMVEGCEFVGTITGQSMVGGLLQGIGKNNARIYAEAEAAERGATHVMWSDVSSGMSGGIASGKAYRCAA